MSEVMEWWARTFEPEGSGGSDWYGGEAERRAETKKNEEIGKVKAVEKKAAEEKAAVEAVEAEKSKKRAQATATQRASYGSNEGNLSRSFLLRL